MSDAGSVDPEAVHAIDGNQGRVATKRPERDALQRGVILGRLVLHHHESRYARLRLRDDETRVDAQRPGGRVSVDHHLARADPPGDDDRDVSRRRAVGLRPAPVIRGPARQVQRDDPSHHRPRPPTRTRPPPCTATARPATAGGSSSPRPFRMPPAGPRATSGLPRPAAGQSRPRRTHFSTDVRQRRSYPRLRPQAAAEEVPPWLSRLRLRQATQLGWRTEPC